jgi:hypothetical protein
MIVPPTRSTWAAHRARARGGPPKGRAVSPAGLRWTGMSLPDAARALLALPPDRFVEERDTLARALASRGDGAAAEVRKLRRPVGLAWVLNRLARERPGELEALLRAGDRLRRGHRRALAGKGAAELRAAEEELRGVARSLRLEAGRVLEGAGRSADPAALSRVELLLRLVAPAPGPERDALRRGDLQAEPEGASAPPAPARGAPLAPLRGDRRGARAAEARAGRDAKREAQRRAREAARRRTAARRELARAEAAAERAEWAAAKAAGWADELRSRAVAARAEVARRREALGAAGDAR